MRTLGLWGVWLAACGGTLPPAVTAEPVIGEAASMQRCEAAEGEEAPYVALDGCLSGDALELAEGVDRIILSELTGEDTAALFADDASWTFGRAATPAAHDVALNRATAVARFAYAIVLAGGPLEVDEASYEAGFTGVEVRFEGDTARLSGTHIELYGSGEDWTTTGVEVGFQRGTDGWRISAFRQWPIDWGTVDESETYDDAYWAQRDRDAATAMVALGEARTAEARRVLVEALMAARRFEEVLDASRPLIDDLPNVDDYDTFSRALMQLGRIEEAQATRAMAEQPTTPIRTLATHMRREWCTEPRQAPVDEEAEYDDPETHCDFEVIAELPRTDDDARGVGVVRTLTGPEAAEAIHLLVHSDGRWLRGPVVSEGPFVGNQTDGVTRIDMSDAELIDLDGAAPVELRMSYERDRIADGDETTDAGFVVCRFAPEQDGRCAWLPTRVARTVGDRTATSEYGVTIEAGQVRVRRQRGAADDSVRVGAFALAELFTD